MRMRNTWLAACLALCAGSLAAQDIQVQGLMQGQAVLSIDGKMRVLRAGASSPEGVTLVSATPAQAIIELNGERRTLGLATHIASRFTAAEHRELKLQSNGRGEYHTSVIINGRQLPALVDTGATYVALSQRTAESIGLDYRLKGTPSRSHTASGTVRSWRMTLERVSLGGIELRQVTASVLEGESPPMVLIGMSVLQKLEMRHQDGVLYLRQTY